MNELSAIPQDSRPLVRARENRLAPWLFAGVAATGAVILFTSLETSRQVRRGEPQGLVDVAPARALPDLVVPTVPVAAPEYATALRSQPRPAVRLTATPGALAPQVYHAPPAQGSATSAYRPEPYPAAPEHVTDEPAGGFPPDFEPIRATAPATNGVQARRIAEPGYTIVQGTMIPAVLETALDSTRPGPVRAITSRDTRGFDGQQVLVPRGSRLIGEYQADVAPGQNRAVISWTRLIRPDGVSIELKAPATDALGRVGVRGKVNNHTFRRVTDTLLQTLVNAGSGFSQRAAPPVIVVPNGAQQAPLLVRDPSAIQPTLTVAQGARVTVFVSQDLDFSSVDGGS